MHQSQPSLHSLRNNLTVHLELIPGNHLIWCNATLFRRLFKYKVYPCKRLEMLSDSSNLVSERHKMSYLRIFSTNSGNSNLFLNPLTFRLRNVIVFSSTGLVCSAVVFISLQSACSGTTVPDRGTGEGLCP